jgi:dUTPase
METFVHAFLGRNENFAILKLSVNSDNQELTELYKKHVEEHNARMISDVYPNSGFDVFIPNSVVFTSEVLAKFVDLEITCEMVDAQMKPSAFLVHPRSSISKTPLMLANHTGIIDSGYRGNLIGAFRWLKSGAETNYTVDKGVRLLQICHPSLCPIFVNIVNKTELSTSERGSGGFGSTGL